MTDKTEVWTHINTKILHKNGGNYWGIIKGKRRLTGVTTKPQDTTFGVGYSQLPGTCPWKYSIKMWLEIYFRWNSIDISVQSQLYGSTTVVMANYGLHWKCQSLTPCQRHPSEPIEKIFGTIGYVIDLNNLSKFGFGKIFGDGGTYTQHIRVCAFFLTFYALRHAHNLNGWTDFDAQYLKRRRLVRGGAFSMIEKNRSMTLTLKRSKSAILFGLQNFNRHYLENGTRYRESVNRSKIGNHIWAFEWWKKIWPQMTSKGQRSRSNPKNIGVKYLENGTR